MNLQEFIDFRKKCPFCDTPLITKFISGRKQKIRFENNSLVAILPIKGLKSYEPDYEAGYSFGLKDNSFSVEFYDAKGIYERISSHMIKEFKEFHKNMSSTKFRFIRACGFCFKYEVESEIIDINLEKCQYSSVEIFNECFVFTTTTEDGYKFILLDNHVGGIDPTSELFWWRSSIDYRTEYTIPLNASARSSLPLIPFISKEETTERLSNLITFA